MAEETKTIHDATVEELERALEEKRLAAKSAAQQKREAYVSLRGSFLNETQSRLVAVIGTVKKFSDWIQKESAAFKEVMMEYGQVRDPGQLSYKLEAGNFRVWVKTNKVKRFDERADLATTRLHEFLSRWIQDAPGGSDNPMYQLAMVLLERNRNGDLESKNISKLYELESRFNDPEYSEIMQLYKESNIISGTATNYYFEQKDGQGVWRRLEPSFNRL